MQTKFLVVAAGIVVAAVALTGCHSNPAKPVSTTAHSRPTPAPQATFSLPASTPNPALNQQAAQILAKENDTLRSGFEEGAKSSAAGTQQAWWASYGDGARLLDETASVFRSADSLFDVSNEPTDAISAWRDDAATFATDVQRWYIAPSSVTETELRGELDALDRDATAVREFH